MELNDLVRVHLYDADTWEAGVLAAREAARESGWRLVRHDQTEDGQFVLHDAITEEHLFTGTVQEGLALLDDGTLADIDSIDDEIDLAETLIAGVPEGLQDAVRDWVDDNIMQARAFAEGR